MTIQAAMSKADRTAQLELKAELAASLALDNFIAFMRGEATFEITRRPGDEDTVTTVRFVPAKAEGHE